MRFERRRVNARQVILHFLAHEHAVGADIDDAALREKSGDEFFDLRIDQRFPAANGDHWRAAFLRRGQAILEAHHVFEAGGIFADASAAGAGQIAGVQRFELQDQREPGRAQHFMLNNVTGDLRRQSERKAHRIRFLEFNLTKKQTIN